MSTKFDKSSKRNSRFGHITIKQPDTSSRIGHALGHKVERDKKRDDSKRKIEVLVTKHPNKSVLTIRTWMHEDSEPGAG